MAGKQNHGTDAKAISAQFDALAQKPIQSER